jgi:hypothetical protein
MATEPNSGAEWNSAEMREGAWPRGKREGRRAATGSIFGLVTLAVSSAVTATLAALIAGPHLRWYGTVLVAVVAAIAGVGFGVVVLMACFAVHAPYVQRDQMRHQRDEMVDARIEERDQTISRLGTEIEDLRRDVAAHTDKAQTIDFLAMQRMFGSWLLDEIEIPHGVLSAEQRKAELERELNEEAPPPDWLTHTKEWQDSVDKLLGRIDRGYQARFSYPLDVTKDEPVPFNEGDFLRFDFRQGRLYREVRHQVAILDEIIGEVRHG